MEGNFRRNFIVTLSIFTIVSTTSFSQSLSEVESALQLSKNLLARLTEGKSPCFSQKCREEKSEILHELHTQTQLLQYLSPEIAELAKEAISSARLQLRRNDQYPLESFRKPKGIQEWLDFYERRFLAHYETEAKWLGFANHIELMRLVPLTLSQLERTLSEEDKVYFQEIWDRGYANTIRLYRKADLLGVEKSKAYAENDQDKVADLEKRIFSLLDEARNWLIENEINLQEFEARVFSGMKPERAREICLYLQIWMDLSSSTQIFSSELFEDINSFGLVLADLQNLNRAYSDREYGVVGLKNFETLDNPAVRASAELEIQSQLDGNLNLMRTILDQGQYSFGLVIAGAMGGSSRLLQFGFFASSNYLQDVMEFKFSNRLLPRTNHLAKLSATQAYWEPRLMTRKRNLERAQQALITKIENLESLRDQLQTEGKENEETNQL